MAGSLKVTTPTDTEIAMTREFDAPRELVFQAYTRPELLKRWLGNHNGWVLAECELDLRPGGRYRYVWRGPNGESMGMGGTYLEIQAPSLVRANERFDEAWYPGNDAESTVTFTEQHGRTTLVMTVKYGSKEARDVALQSPMDQGIGMGFEVLDGVLDGLKGAGKR